MNLQEIVTRALTAQAWATAIQACAHEFGEHGNETGDAGAFERGWDSGVDSTVEHLAELPAPADLANEIVGGLGLHVAPRAELARTTTRNAVKAARAALADLEERIEAELLAAIGTAALEQALSSRDGWKARAIDAEAALEASRETARTAQAAIHGATNESNKERECPDGSRADAGETTPVAAPSSDPVTSEPAKLDVDGAPTMGARPITCTHCNDTHRMQLAERSVWCTHCPTPCVHCRGHLSAYCSSTPCNCVCHARPTRVHSINAAPAASKEPACP